MWINGQLFIRLFLNIQHLLLFQYIQFSVAKEMISINNDFPTDDSKPYFTEKMSNVTVQAGRSVKFQCIVGNLGNHQVAWFRKDKHTLLALGNEVILKNNRIIVSNHTDKIFYLRLEGVKEEDRGEYMCQINSSPQIDQSAFLQVTVPPHFIEELTSSDTDVNEDESVSLRCIAKGSPAPTIEWRREDKEAIDALSSSSSLPSSPSSSSSSSSSSSDNKNVITLQGEYLNIGRVRRQHMGAYLCIASNGIPNSVSKRIFLGVKFPPLVWTPNQRLGSPLGGDASILCTVDAYPKPDCFWMKSRQIILDNNKYSTLLTLTSAYKYEMRLFIKNVEPSDFTSYTCIAKNILSEASGTIVLYETPRPSTQRTVVNSIPNPPLTKEVTKNRKTYLGTSKTPLNSEDNVKDKLNLASFLTNSYKNDIAPEQITLQTEEKVTPADDLTDSGANFLYRSILTSIWFIGLNIILCHLIT